MLIKKSKIGNRQASVKFQGYLAYLASTNG
jgi:hypothetical protein